MSNELSVIDTNVLTNEEKTELDKNLERIIAEHKNNRQEINRLVFESVAAMTEADDAESELSNKGFFQRLIGGITGSNQKLQNKINSNRAAAQYASQQTLQKLAEQNLMSFDLITAVNNKLNASINSVNDEFKNIYSGLSKFLKYNRNELARIESRLAKVEQNVNLLTWQNSIEYQEFEGEEYSEMDNIKKIVCLVRDFYDITKGNWSTSDLLLLKTAMSTIGIQPKEPINYYNVLSEINHSQPLWKKLLGNVDIRPIKNPSYLISMGTLEKLNALENRDSYIVDTIIDFIDNDTKSISRDNICDELTKNYLQKKASVNINIAVESYDLILDLLYNIKQAKDENLLLISTDKQNEMISKAEQLFLNCRFDESIEILNVLAENDNPKAMYLLGEIYCWALPKNKINRKLSDFWRKKGATHNNILCQLNLAYNSDVDDNQKETIISNMLNQIINLANAGDMYAQEELGSIYRDRGNEEKAMEFYHLAAAQGFFAALNNLGDIYYKKENYSEAAHWYKLAGEAGYDWGWRNLAMLYDEGKGFSEDKNKAIELLKKAFDMNGEGKGFSEDKNKAIELLKKAFDMNGNANGQSANEIGVIYYNKEDYSKAMHWYELAGEAGYDWGWKNLATLYDNGIGVHEDKDKAIEFYKKAYDASGKTKGECANIIGLFYYNKDNYQNANKWFERAGEAGNSWGWNNLANDYSWGKGLTIDTEKAKYYYKKACELEGEATSNAAFQLGSLYENDGNYNDAKKWYRISANAGNIDAQNALNEYFTVRKPLMKYHRFME